MNVLKKKTRIRILSIGCGRNIWLEASLAEIIPQAQIVAADCHQDSVLSVERRSDIDLVVLDVRDPLPFAVGLFDVVIINAAVGYLDKTQQDIIGTLARLSSLIKNGGGLFMHTTLKDCYTQFPHYYNGLDWLADGLRGQDIFKKVDTTIVSEKYKTGMVTAYK